MESHPSLIIGLLVILFCEDRKEYYFCRNNRKKKLMNKKESQELLRRIKHLEIEQQRDKDKIKKLLLEKQSQSSQIRTLKSKLRKDHHQQYQRADGDELKKKIKEVLSSLPLTDTNILI